MQTSSTFVSLRRSARQLALAATLGAAAISAQAQAPAQQQAAPSIDSFVSTAASYLTAISQGKAADVWQNSSPEMQKSETKKNFAKNIEAKYTEAGQITAREWIAVNRIVLVAPVKADKVTTPAGQYINVTFVASTNKNRNIAERVTFYLDKDGITFYYNVYDITPYAMGPVEIKIPYEMMEHMLGSNPIIGEMKSK